MACFEFGILILCLLIDFMKLFIIPSWYPTKLHPESGSFFQDQAILLDQMETEVYLLTSIQHSFKDIFYYKEIGGNTESKEDEKGNGDQIGGSIEGKEDENSLLQLKYHWFLNNTPQNNK